MFSSDSDSSSFSLQSYPTPNKLDCCALPLNSCQIILQKPSFVIWVLEYLFFLLCAVVKHNFHGKVNIASQMVQIGKNLPAMQETWV